jgi:hypothetical protein
MDKRGREEVNDEKEKFDKFYQKVDRLIENKSLFIATMTGCAAHLLEFIHNNVPQKDIPMYTRYCMSLVACNIFSLISDEDKPLPFLDYSDYRMSEQTQEKIRRTVKEICLAILEGLDDEEDGK